MALVAVALALSGCHSAYDSADAEGPPSSWNGAWVSDNDAVVVKQDGDHAVAQWRGPSEPYIDRSEGVVRGRVLRMTVYSKAGSESDEAFTQSKDGQSAIYKYRGGTIDQIVLGVSGGWGPPRTFLRFVAGPSSECAALESRAMVSGGLIARLPVGPDGVPLATLSGAPQRDVLAYMTWGRRPDGMIVPYRTVIPVAAPRKVVGQGEVPELAEIGFDALRRARARSPFHAKTQLEIDGRPAWAVMNPIWAGYATELAPGALFVELYRDDPDGGTPPFDVVWMGVVDAQWRFQPNDSYVTACATPTRLHLSPAGTGWKVESQVAVEPPVDDFLWAKEWTTLDGRWRNRMLLEAKAKSLPKALATRKTDELGALKLRIEQTILDLAHEKELAKDAAQRLVEKNAPADADGRTVDVLRELALIYQERIEVLKAILAAVAEEVANRNR